MIKQVIAIGGGGFGRNPGQGLIEKYILDQSNTVCPNICFIPTATGDEANYVVNYYTTFSKLNCNPIHLDLFKRTPNLKKLIKRQDIIFVGGGNTKSMLAVWKDWGINVLLKEAYENGSIMCGVSAGAICWFEKGITDSWQGELRLMNCLGFLKGTCCPHYDEEPERKPFVKNYLTKKKISFCFAIEGSSALHFKDGKPYTAISFGKNKNSYNVKFIKNNFVENPYSKIKV
ncbi:MAG: peptidase E [Rickettsiales bacterium]|nr:peptidase E [Rickettsiales bacterium]OUW03147.1 MAG: peptidase E [Betaproteobacteria bacterium TMED156]